MQFTRCLWSKMGMDMESQGGAKMQVFHVLVVATTTTYK
jgi:hypothetical protein